MERALRIDTAAQADITEAVERYEGARAGLGWEFFEELGRLLRRALAFPEMYRAYRRGIRRAVVRRFPYIVLYRFNDAEVQVIAVFHGARRPGQFLRRAASSN